MDQLIPTLYTSAVVPVRHGAWRQVQLPTTVDTTEGLLTTSGRSFGLHAGPDQLIPTMPGRLTVRSLLPVTVDVEIELGIWSREERQLGIRPRRNLPWWVPVERYLDAALAVVDELAVHFRSEALAADAAELLQPTGIASVADAGDEDPLPLSA